MKRGWRNDPAWVEHYRLRDERRIQKEIELMKFNVDQVMLQERLSASIAAMRRKPDYKVVGY